MSNFMIALIIVGGMLAILGVSFRKRLALIFKAKANTIADTLENPVEMADQILRELRTKLQQGIEGEAQIKAMVLGLRADEAKFRAKADEWETKANALLDKMEQPGADVENLTKLAETAATEHQNALTQAETYAKNATTQEAKLAKLDATIKELRNTITKTETDVKMLKSEKQIADASLTINKTMSSVDTDGLMQTMKRMQEKVSQTALTSEAYAEVSDSTMSSAQEIDKVLGSSSGSDALAALKNKRNGSVKAN